MTRHTKLPTRALASALAFLMAFALAAPPALAAEAETEAPSPAESQALSSPTTERPTLVALAEARVQSADPPAAVAPAQANEMTSEKSFFRSPQGIAAIVLLVGGTVLVAYSRSHDRPRSVVR